MIKYFFIKALVLIFSTILFFGCQQIPQNSLPPEKLKSEIEQAIAIIKTQPDWLKDNVACVKDLMPETEKKISFLDDGCEGNPKKCLENCQKEDGNACYMLALLIQKNIDFKQEQSIPLFRRACKLGVVSGCTNAAAAQFNLDKADSEAIKCSVDTFEKTCEKDDPWGCTMFGMVLADGTGRLQDLNEALKVLSKSCKYGDEDEACRNAKELMQQINDYKNRKKDDSNTNTKAKARSN